MKILPLIVRNLNYKINNNFILKNININTVEKKVTIIAGNNGSGKSTLLKVLHGLIKMPESTIKWGEFTTSDIKKINQWYFKHQYF